MDSDFEYNNNEPEKEIKMTQMAAGKIPQTFIDSSMSFTINLMW